MPKPHTFQTLYDEVKTVSIFFLAKHGYLKPNQWKAGSVNWSRNGEKTSSISKAMNFTTNLIKRISKKRMQENQLKSICE